VRGHEGHYGNVAALAGLHSSETEPVSETFKTMANGSLDGVPPLLVIKEEERKRQQKDAKHMRIAE
jgi:hypothetical protein